MSKRPRRLLGLILALILIGSLVTFRALIVPRSFPQIDGEIQLPGLDAPVDVFRDSFGIPHIYASTERDLFMAQGFVSAQDRFWQMDFQRHASSGRLSELVGGGGLEIDKFVRTLGWERVAQQEVANLSSEELAILQAYADGVNAYLEGRRGTALSLEYAFVGLINSGYAPPPWEPLHSLTWAKAMAWQLGDNLDLEIERALLLKTLTPEQVGEIRPPYPADNPLIADIPSTAPLSATTPQTDTLPSEVTPALESLEKKVSMLDTLFGSRDADVGSNSWAIAGSRTSTGLPLLANDPHLPAQIPALWYEIGLHCAPIGPECPFEVSGFALLGVPGVVIGHNDRIAWAFTDIADDVQDLYIERVNPENPDQYEVNGRWVDMQLITEAIQVGSRDPVEFPVRLTRHGPIISEVFEDLEDLDQKAGIDLPEHYAIALRWTALEPSTVFRAVLGFNRAGNWEAFRQAARSFDVPAQNLLYADVDGNIGYQTPGKIPIRTGWDGTLPAPGWTVAYEWEGTIPFEALPSVFNPPEGYIVTANNAIVGPAYPYAISQVWDYGFRARRIVELIEGAPGPIDLDYVHQMQGDNLNLIAARLVPMLLTLPLDDPRLNRARDLLQGWDFQADMESPAAAMFEAFWRHLLAATFHDDLPEPLWPDGDSTWFEVVRHLVAEPESAWWDDRNTQEVENRDDVFRRAFSAAVDELERLLGWDPASWTWGDLHTLTFRNEVMDNFPLVNLFFNRGPFRTSGGSSLVNNTHWNAAESYLIAGSMPSMRMIVDLSDMSNSRAIHTAGQSGHAYHRHYIDMADLWRTVQYHPMLLDRQQIEAASEGHLTLTP